MNLKIHKKWSVTKKKDKMIREILEYLNDMRKKQKKNWMKF